MRTPETLVFHYYPEWRGWRWLALLRPRRSATTAHGTQRTRRPPAADRQRRPPCSVTAALGWRDARPSGWRGIGVMGAVRVDRIRTGKRVPFRRYQAPLASETSGQGGRRATPRRT